MDFVTSLESETMRSSNESKAMRSINGTIPIPNTTTLLSFSNYEGNADLDALVNAKAISSYIIGWIKGVIYVNWINTEK